MNATVRVLHVDDEPAFADAARALLERAEDRLDIETVASASEGLDYLAGTEVDCIVSDYDMPGKNGIEFLQAVRADHPDLPFILFTGKGSEEIASEAISAGVTDYLQKGTGTDRYTLLANRIVNAAERFAAKREVETTRNRFETLLEHSADYIHVLDADGTARYHSPSVERVLGYGPAELDGTDPFEKLHPDDREDAWALFEECIETPGKQVTMEMRARHKDGSWRWLEVKSRNLLEDSLIGGVVGNVRDITQRKETEAAVDWHRAVIRNMGEGVYVIDTDYELQFVNYRARELDGLSEQDWAGRQLSYLAESGILPPDEVDAIREGADRIVAGESQRESIEIEPAIPESTEVVELRLGPFEAGTDEDLILGTTRDITEFKRRERELRDEKAFNRAALEGFADAYWTVDLDGTITEWSDTEGTATGYTTEEAVGMHASEFYPDEHKERINRALDEMRAGQSTTLEADFLTKDGERIPFYLTGVPLEDDTGAVRAMAGFGQDISEQKERERHLEQFELVVDSVDDSVFVVDDDWTVGYANEAALNAVGATKAEVENQQILPLTRASLSDDETVQPFVDALERAFDTSADAPERVELTLDVAGEGPTFEYQFSPILTDGAVEAVAIISRDITER